MPTLRRSRSQCRSLALQRSDHDVVVVGAGIIGLTIARQLLLSSDLSVAVVDAAVPCSGATGAGQGYVWMAHKTPGSAVWELGLRSKQMWEEMAEGLERDGEDPLDVLGWRRTGSLVIGTTSDELVMLKERVRLFSQAGLRAEYWSASSLLSEEPALEVGKESSAVFLPDDCQIDAARAVDFIQKVNKGFATEGRYTEFFNNPAIRLLRSDRNGEVEAVETSHNILYGEKAIVIAAGAWSGTLMRSLVVNSPTLPDVPVKPRKGHLLVLENFNKIQLNHGVMEAGYIGHQVTKIPKASLVSETIDEHSLSSISMTATLDSMGNLVLGSSRQFTGFGTELDESIVQRIWDRAGKFFPSLRVLSHDIKQYKEIRIGLRPYMPDGKPIIGPFPGLPKVLLATGHEGSGLSLALGTAEMISDMILENPLKVDCTPFLYPR
ncbi:hydrogen cyanide synthase subunit HcnC [Dioscorea cayenensis subsp. rotundata]|uniref:FAD-dependent oxidoreductase domain-containing protein 1 n=1 Tax=Dioscorea cayennensis subsp. rotundata TaxID=55577 RepID=A0AB40AZA0_DIOCR|nr:hydrogen cyanide synthase subunit HcnC [Dioscorea cayenensis subsp. rotundata]